MGLRRYLNSERQFAESQDSVNGDAGRHQPTHAPFAGPANGATAADPNNNDGAFDEGEPDVVEDDDGLEDGNEMAIDNPPPVDHDTYSGLGLIPEPLPSNLPPPPPPVSLSTTNPFPGLNGFTPAGPQDIQIQDVPILFAQAVQPPPAVLNEEGESDAMDTSPTRLADEPASMAVGGGQVLQAARSRQASGAGPFTTEAGPSTASTLALPLGSARAPTSIQGASRSATRSNNHGPTSGP